MSANTNWKEKLASLNRQYREMILKSQDGTNELPVFYRRPTELEDDILRKAMEQEFEAIKDGLKHAGEGKDSLFEQLRKSFNEGKPDAAIGYIVLERIPGIREAAKLEASLKDWAMMLRKKRKMRGLKNLRNPLTVVYKMQKTSGRKFQ